MTKLKRLTTLIGLLCALPLLAVAGTLPGNNPAVMLQGFHWRSHETYPWWNVISTKAPDIAGSGFKMVWLPPSGRSASNEGYLPNELYTQDSRYGSQAQLQSALSALRSRGVRVLADVVINHRVGTLDWADFTKPSWGSNAVCKGDEWGGASGNYDTGWGFNGGRDIDHTQAFVQTDIKAWLNWMKGTIGYDGWRYDYVAGYNGYYTGQYNLATSPYFSVGEYWDTLDLNNPDAHRQRIVNWMDATGGNSAAFDFTTKGLLQQAVQYNEFWRLRDSQGKPAGVVGWWPSNTVTFIDNHDTGPAYPSGGQNHWPFPGDKIMQGYAYLLTHPGIPCVFWVHFYDWGYATDIKRLMQIRASKGITSTSAVSIAVADNSRYAAYITGSAGRVAMKIGWGSWSPGAGWTLAASGNNYAVWTQ